MTCYMTKYHSQKQEIIHLLQRLSLILEEASKGKVSTDEITPERLLWEIYNKIFTLIVSCESCIRLKDSLVSHLVARYTYELLIVFAYIFQDKDSRSERVDKFLNFNQFKTPERKWTKVEYSQMINGLPDGERFSMHKSLYRKLSNFAHPTMDSFLLNRRGPDVELLLILNTVLLTLGAMFEIVDICIKEKLYFDESTDLSLEINSLRFETDRIMKELVST